LSAQTRWSCGLALAAVLGASGSASAAGGATRAASLRKDSVQATTGSEGPGAVPPLLAAFVGLDFAGRRLSYRDALTPNLRSYEVPATVGAAGSLELAPFAGSDNWFFAGLSLFGSAHARPSFRSRSAEGSEVDSTWYGYRAQLRFAFVRTPGLQVKLLGGLGGEKLSFSGDKPIADAPSLDAQVATVGALAVARSGRWSGTLSAAYLPVLSTVLAGDAVRGAKAGGLEAELAGLVALSTRLSLRAAVGYTRFFYGFDPVPGDTHVVGGALDQLVHLQTGVVVSL
jgi:hypothetical protein